MGKKKQAVLQEISRELTGSREVRTRYKSGNLTITVQSSFGTEKLEDLLFVAIKSQFTLDTDTENMLYLESSQSDTCPPQIGGTK